MTRIAIQGVGYTFLVLGVLGLFLPILQGILFIAVGLIILSRHATWAENLLARLKARHPRADDIITRAEDFAEKWTARTVDFVRSKF
ncbi:MAG: hypothetical protein H6851_06610 [Geminicoccaceae bacterium]|nr:hypothetical protein [Geminicoccaceae bacterium]MCB9943278.1 hypothetical protein [Geminicoccaceae bacterium]